MIKHTNIHQPDPTKPQPGAFDAGHVDEHGNEPPAWLYDAAGKMIGVKSPGTGIEIPFCKTDPVTGWISLSACGNTLGSPGMASKFRNKSPVGWHSLAAYLQTATSPGYDARTYQLAHVVESQVLAVRCIILCNEAAGYTLNNVTVATSDRIDNANFNPVTAGSTSAFTAVTFNGSASVSIPARLGVNRPSRTVSDWINVQSIAPVDGNTLPYMFWRAYYATGPSSAFGNTSQLMATGSGALAALGSAIWASPSDSRSAKRLSLIADHAGNLTAGAFTSPSQNYGCLAMEFEYIYDRDVLTVCAVGDSITQGDTASVMALSPVHFACNSVSTPATPVVPCNQGFSSQTTSNFSDRLTDMIASGRRPQIVVYSAWSPNDISGGNVTAAAVALMKFNLAKAMAACEQAGIVMILTTGLPYAFTAPNDANRIALNNYLRGLATYGVLICDYDATLSNGATPAVIQYPNYAAATQSLHPYDGGYVAMGQVLANVLASAVTQYFSK